MSSATLLHAFRKNEDDSSEILSTVGKTTLHKHTRLTI